MTYKGLPVYNINIEAQDEEFLGLTCVSIVSEPAVCEELYCFDKAEKKQMIFTSDNNEQHCITSVALLSDTPIYRVDQYGNGYYVVFEKQTIRDLVEKYSKDGYNNITSFQHDGQEIDDFIMIESYFVDKENGVVNNRFDVPDGSWIVTYKCTNEETWNKVKNELSTGGYSVEIICDITPAKDGQHIEEEPEPNDYQINPEVEDWLSELLAWLEEDEDVEVIMSKDEKWLINGDGEYWLDEDGNKVPAKCPKCGGDVGVYIKGEPIFLCSECREYLGTVKFPDDLDFSHIKKNFRRVTTGDLEDIMKKNRKAVVTINDQPKTVQVNSLGTDQSGKPIAVVYEPTSKDWTVVKVHDIQKVEMIEEECENVEYNSKWKNIVSDETIDINKTLAGMNPGKDSIDWVMDRNAYVEIDYFDETDTAATGYRTMTVTSWGYTQKHGGGNEAIRCYQWSGSSKTGFEDGRWRLLLTRRIRSFKAVNYVNPPLQAPPQYNGEAQQGTGKNGTMSSVKRTAVFPATKRIDE